MVIRREKWNYGLATHIGPVRKGNEDRATLRIHAARDKKLLALVADGMGGLHAGDVASTIAQETVLSYWKSYLGASTPQKEINSQFLRDAFSKANHRIFVKSRENNNTMGTTLSVLLLWGERYYLLHIGDSRIYRIRVDEGEDEKTEPLNEQQESLFWHITQLTQDHTWVAEEVLRGGLTEDVARVHPKKNLLTRCLGAKSHAEADCIEGEYLPGDYFLLCSDGLYSLFTSHQILDMIRIGLDAGCSLQTIAENMVQSALKAGTRDNVTIILVGPNKQGTNMLSRIVRRIRKYAITK
jgi:protein phosphatase